MRYPKLQTVAGKVKNVTDKLWVQLVVIPLIFFLGPSLTATYYSVDSFKSEANGLLPSALSDFLNHHVLSITTLALLLSFLVSNINSILDKLVSSDGSLTTEGLLALKESLEKIVQYKAQRFESECARINPNGQLTEASVFQAITRPDQQIIFIAHALNGFLEAITKDIDFKVRLIKIENHLPVGWYTYAPDNEPPKTEITVLQNQDSSVSICLRKKSLFVVEDIEAAAVKQGGREYVMSHQDPSDEIGSLVCYPVYHKQTRCYPFILAVSANKPFFMNHKKELYKWIFDQFALRLQLEYSLLVLKENCRHE